MSGGTPVWYNENDIYSARWLANLYPEATVDTRSITDVTGADLVGYRRCHFFAGIGGWEYALSLAGWPADRPVWTGSCPCQPFSAAGKGKGAADERHLWPAWFRLIRERRPQCIFGEQVAGAIGHGWLDGVFGDLEGEGYSCGAIVLGAHSVGAPHIRQRLYWVGHADNAGPQGRREHAGQHADQLSPWAASVLIPCSDGRSRRVPATEAGEPEPGLFPLAHGVSDRVGKLRAYGNAIVPQVAAAFVTAFLETAL